MEGFLQTGVLMWLRRAPDSNFDRCLEQFAHASASRGSRILGISVKRRLRVFVLASSLYGSERPHGRTNGPQ